MRFPPPSLLSPHRDLCIDHGGCPCSGAGAGVRADHTVAREEGQEAGRLSRSASSGQAKASRGRVFGAQRVLNTQHTLYQCLRYKQFHVLIKVLSD